MIRRVLAFLGRFVAVVLAILAGLGCFVAGIWSNEPILSIIFCCIAAVCFFIVRLVFGLLDRPLDEDVDRWFALYGPIVLCVIAALGIYWEFREQRQPSVILPAYDELQVSTGVLREGMDGDFYLKRDGLPDLKLICAFNKKSRRGGPNSCDDRTELPYLGRQVTVYHQNPRKMVLWEAAYYEMRAGNHVIIPYGWTIDALRERYARLRRVDYSICIMLIIMGFYMPVEYAIRRRRENKRHKVLDESMPATQ